MPSRCPPDASTHTLRRYARHTVLPEVGEEGQARLLSSSALVVGAGGLGSNALACLAAAGFGRLGIIEHDRVELSNLQRQLLYETADIGRYKAEAARDRLEEMNPDIRIDCHVTALSPENAMSLVRGYDMVLDGSDNFETRFALSNACLNAGIPLVSAAVRGFSAQLSTFKPYLGAPHPCYRCLIPHPPEQDNSCAQEGIIGPLASLMGSMQALEAIKERLDIGSSLSGWLLQYDLLSQSWRRTRLLRDAACRECKHLA